MKNIKTCFIVAALLILNSCVAPTTKRGNISDVLAAEEEKKQHSLALRSYFERNERLENLSYPLQLASSEICEKGNLLKRAGFSYHNLSTINNEWHAAAISEYGIGESYSITNVIPNSPADKAGLAKKDILVSIDGEDLSLGKNSTKVNDEIWKEKTKDGVVDILVLRGGNKKQLTVYPINTCSYPVVYVNNDTLNAYADGDAVYIHKGLMRFTNDLELSTVIAHEIAHNAMQHIEAKQTNRAGGIVLDILVTAATGGINPGFSDHAGNMYSQEFEAEADYVGIYIMARAGLDISKTANFWRRMAIENPGNIEKSISATHPSTPERFVGIENAVKEIQEKIKNNEELLPNLKN